MHPPITEMMMRERSAELRRRADAIVLADGRRVAARSLRSPAHGRVIDRLARLMATISRWRGRRPRHTSRARPRSSAG